jgi:hypothetical protein
MDATAVLARHRPWLGRALPWAAGVMGMAAVLAGFLVEAGPARRFVVFYIAPMVVAFPLWARVRLDGIERRPRARIVLDAAVVVLAVARTVTGLLPFSGHMLFLTYSLLTTRERLYQAIAVLLLVETTWFKLGLWSDLRSWSIGLVAGLAAAGAWAVAGRKGEG